MDLVKLNKILNYARQNVPYYIDQNIKEKCNIEDFPIVGKCLIKENFTSFVSNDVNLNDMFIEYTSGSTGIPMKCIKSKKETLISQKKIWSWRAENVSNVFGKKLLVFSNDIITKSELSNFGGEIANNYYGKVQYKYITPRDLQEVDIKDIVSYIYAYKPNWIRSTPSNLYYFCKKVESISPKVLFNDIEFIELSGETVEEYHINTLKKFFKCPIGNHYGCREVWPIACECNYGVLHILEDHVYCETINNKYDQNAGELCITALNQYSFPYIRYNIGDIVSLDRVKCKCGRSGVVIKKLFGRTSDLIKIDEKYYTPQIFTQPIKKMVRQELINPRRFMVVEEKKHHFIIYLEQTSNSNIDFENFLISYFNKYISSNITIKIVFCNQIPIDLKAKNKYYIKSEEL